MPTLILEEKMNRSINRVVQGMASVVFLPMGLWCVTDFQLYLKSG